MDDTGSLISLSIETLSSLSKQPIISCLGIILILIIVNILLKLCNDILSPMYYKLDMTSKDYCKQIAEIDNSLRFKRGQNGEFQNQNLTTGNSQKTPIDCATDLADDALNNNNSDSINNNNSEAGGKSGGGGGGNTGSANHVYPNGWIPVMESYKLKSGTVRKAIIFGRDVIVTRSADGQQVNVLDAYCPHMGVHIGIGGQVRQVDNDSCVECPFHGWTFRSSDGQCVKIPYQKNGNKCHIPKQAKLATWDCVEIDHFIYVWHHIDNQPPNWFLTPSEELKSYQLAGRSCHRTNLELRDMHENGADMNHFEGIHNDLFVFGGEIIKVRPLSYLQKYARHHWLPEWKPLKNELGKATHKAEMKLQSWVSMLGFRLFDITVEAIQIGPARVNLYYNSKWYGKGILIMNAIPLGGRQTKYIQHIYTERRLFHFFMAKWVLYGEIKMLERDFFIWNHKKNINNPIFIPEDKTLKQFRLWYSQFYQRKRTIVIQNGDMNQQKPICSMDSKNNNNSIDF